MLSDDLDSLPDPRRVPALLSRLRDEDDPGARLAGLAAGGPTARYLAAVAAGASGHRPIVAGALRDPDPAVRAEAARQALRRGWTTGGELLADAPPVLRHLVLRLLRKYPGSGDAVIDLVRERYGDREAAVLLPACSAPVVARLLPALARSTVSWKVLARRHSTAVLDWADATLSAAGSPDWAPVLDAVQACAALQPARVLDLLERHTTDPLPLIDLAPLAARFPSRVVALVATRVESRSSWQYLPDRVMRHLLALGLDDLVALSRVAWKLLEMLPPDRRVALFDATRPELPYPEQVDLLPEPAREREVRRVLALPRVAGDEALTRSWRTHLPAAEALQILDERARDPDAYVRQGAYQAMVAVAGREPAALPRVLDRLRRLRNEREGVRKEVLRTFTVLIPHLTGAVVPALAAVVDATIEARDLSRPQEDFLGEFAWMVLAGAGDDEVVSRWALDLIARVPIPTYVETPLRPGQEHLVEAALLKRITADTAELFDLVLLLEKRARALPAVQDLLGRAADPASPADVRARAVTMWLDDPRTRSARAATILRADPTAISLAPVWREVSGFSTDLLDEILFAPAAPLPSVAAAGLVPVLAAAGLVPVLAAAGPPGRVRRWTVRQQRAYATALAAVAADPDTDQRVRVAAVKNLARVPVTGRELLGDFLDVPSTPIAEAALGALPWTDRPDEALPILLTHAGGDRARVALPAADRAARFVNPSVLISLLRGVLLAPPAAPVRVSSRKAAVRILARYGPPESPELLAEVWHAPGAHTDVRATVVTALRGPVPSPAAWAIFTEAAGSAERAEVAALLACTPQELAEPGRARFAELVVSACASPDRTIAWAAFERLPQWIPWAPQAVDLVVAALADPDFTGPGTYRPDPAYTALVAALLESPAAAGRNPAPAGSNPAAADSNPATAGNNPDGAGDDSAGPGGDGRFGGTGRSALAEVFDRLVARDQQDTEPSRPDRDRPVRRSLTRITDTAARRVRSHPCADPEPARAAARGLAAHPGFLDDGAELLLALARVEAEPLAEVADLVAGRPALAVRLAGQLGESAKDTARPETARTLGDRGDLAGGLFALALVSAAGGASRWKEPWPVALNRLRDHPQPDVAAGALRRQMYR
ncbi:hypothetical protein [Actinoplanes subglobosus]|uniref:Uncharacterized protein n=1 Tax=Actinoplanes subglobosus TaxID=1547892 RepID=A0ABV8J1Z4_9ACTN